MNRAETIVKMQKSESPIIRTEYNGVQVTITFDENADDKNIKIGMRIAFTWKDRAQNCILSKICVSNVDYLEPKDIFVKGIHHVSGAQTLTIMLSIEDSIVGLKEIRLLGDDLT